MITIHTTAGVLAAAIVFVSKDDARSYLKRICFELGPTDSFQVVATDGYRMIMLDPKTHKFLRSEDDSRDQVIVALDQDTRVDMKKPKNRELAVKLEVCELTETVQVSYGSTVRVGTVFSQDGFRFPDWRRIIPEDFVQGRVQEKEPNSGGHYNARYLADVHVAAKLLTGSRDPRIDVFTRAERASGLFRLYGPLPEDQYGVLAYAAVMPVRKDASG